MSKRDRQGARTVADLSRRYNARRGVERAMVAASDAGKSASEAKTELAGKVSKKDYNTVVDMINAADAIVRFLAGRVVIQSANFTLDENGSVVAKDITLQNGADTDEYSVKIADGVIKINAPTVITSLPEISDVTFQYVDLLQFNLTGTNGGVFALFVEMTDQDENGYGGGEWTMNRIGIRRVT